jgi:hypothetical protein
MSMEYPGISLGHGSLARASRVLPNGVLAKAMLNDFNGLGVESLLLPIRG